MHMQGTSGTWLFLHGFTGTPASWNAVRAHLPATVQTSAIALPGHAQGVPACSGFDETCFFIERTAQALPQPVHLVGYSLGARIALGTAVRSPSVAKSLTLIGVHPGLETAQARAERVQNDGVWYQHLVHQGIDAFVDAWEQQPIFASQSRADAAVLKQQSAARRAHDPAALAASLRAAGLGAMPNFWADLSRLHMPVHLIVGGDDSKFLALAQRAAALLSEGRLTVLPDCGHNPLLEAPQALAAALGTDSL